MKTLRDAKQAQLNAETKQEARWNAQDVKAKGIVKAYREDYTIGYDNGIRELMALGYAEHEADDLLVPLLK